MAQILNTTERPLKLKVYATGPAGNLINKDFRFIPGEPKEVSAKHLEAFKQQKGFKRWSEKGYLKVLNEGETADDIAVDAVEITDKASALAKENDIDISSLEPNDKNTITVAIVKAAIKERDAADASDSGNEDL